MNKLKYFKINNYIEYMLLVDDWEANILINTTQPIRRPTKNKEISIIIDLFYYTGFSENRFVEITWKKGSQTLIKEVNINKIPETIKNNTLEYFRNNPDILINSKISKDSKRFMGCCYE